MRLLVCAAMATMLLVGCAGRHKAEVHPLHAPAGISAAVSQQLEEGNQLFGKEDWAGARQVYLATIQADHTVAEAHYNLGLALAQQGKKAEAKDWAERVLRKKLTMPSYLRRRERPWFRKAAALLKRL